MLSILFLFVFNFDQLQTSNSGVCQDDRGSIIKCCADFIEKNGKCIPCPVGSFGIQCSSTCPIGFYGFLCKTKCKCRSDQRCHPETGCFQFGNSTDIIASIERNNHAVSITIVTLFFILPGSVFIAMLVMKRLNLCADRLERVRLPGFCIVQGSTQDDTEDVENSRGNSRERKSQTESDGDVSTNQNCGNQCILATDCELYDAANNEVKEEYDLLELRLRNV